VKFWFPEVADPSWIVVLNDPVAVSWVLSQVTISPVTSSVKWIAGEPATAGVAAQRPAATMTAAVNRRIFLPFRIGGEPKMPLLGRVV
jgi:hypothetical protein